MPPGKCVLVLAEVSKFTSESGDVSNIRVLRDNEI